MLSKAQVIARLESMEVASMVNVGGDVITPFVPGQGWVEDMTLPDGTLLFVSHVGRDELGNEKERVIALEKSGRTFKALASGLLSDLGVPARQEGETYLSRARKGFAQLDLC
jgi:hypothetical protein